MNNSLIGLDFSWGLHPMQLTSMALLGIKKKNQRQSNKNVHLHQFVFSLFGEVFTHIIKKNYGRGWVERVYLAMWKETTNHIQICK